MKALEIGKARMGGNAPLALIAGPCVLEDEAVILRTARDIGKITASAPGPMACFSWA